jgi:hypothetical protein
VRGQSTTLGETLQSLKSLRNHLKGGTVCLFVKDIPNLWREVPANEDFRVLTQREMFKFG